MVSAADLIEKNFRIKFCMNSYFKILKNDSTIFVDKGFSPYSIKPSQFDLLLNLKHYNYGRYMVLH